MEDYKYCTNCEKDVKTRLEEVRDYFDSQDTFIEEFCCECNYLLDR